MRRFQYLACDGGPHLVLPKAQASTWRGVPLNVANVLDPTTDYGRACAIDGEVGLVDVGNDKAIVLGRNPPISTFAPSLDECGVDFFVITCWSSGADLDDVVEDGRRVQTRDMKSMGLSWNLSEAGAFLMYAGDRIARPVYAVIEVPIPMGRYNLFIHDENLPKGDVTVIRALLGGSTG